MAWCHQAASHYLSQCWPRSRSPYGVTRPQWVNLFIITCISMHISILRYVQVHTVNSQRRWLNMRSLRICTSFTCFAAKPKTTTICSHVWQKWYFQECSHALIYYITIFCTFMTAGLQGLMEQILPHKWGLRNHDTLSCDRLRVHCILLKGGWPSNMIILRKKLWLNSNYLCKK